jgi:hypothetical protein
MPQISWIAVLVATLAGFALGAVWYGPLFGKAWMRHVGLTREQLSGFNPAVTYGTTFLWALVTAVVLGAELGPAPTVSWAVSCGAAVGGLLVLPSLATNYLFEGKPFLLTAINGGYHVVRFALMGLVFGLLG